MKHASFTRILLFSCFLFFTFAGTEIMAQCGCDHVLANNTYRVNGASLNVMPGDKVCFQNGTRGAVYFENFVGTAANPILITNMCDGSITFTGPKSSPFSIEFHRSKHFRFSGSGNAGIEYGIEINGTHFGIDLKELSTNFEVDHLRIDDLGYAGISAKTDPNCNSETWRGNFLMEDISLHDNYITNTGGEGFYVGESHYHRTVAKNCSGSTLQLEEHEVINVKIFNNRLENIGRDGIQLGACTSGGEIYDNYVYNYGAGGVFGHQSGIQINPGTAPIVRNNLLLVGTGYGIFADGIGGTVIKNNIIANALQGGFFAKDEGASQNNGKGFWFINNTLVNNNDYGIYTLSENTVNNQFLNNIIIGTNQASFRYVRLNNPSAIDWNESNNIFTETIGDLNFADPANDDYHINTGSSAINAGLNALSYGVTDDYDYASRPSSGNFDVGALQLVLSGPVGNAGPNRTINLPTNTVILNGSGSSNSSTITGYSWSKLSGGSATLLNANTDDLTVNGLTEGVYQFQLEVTDNLAATDTDVAQVTVIAPANVPPTANAGSNRTITLPTNSLNINGVGTDSDGTITTYSWSKTAGPSVTISGASSANLSLTNLIEGSYTFRLTVTDDDGATATDNVSITVNAAAVNQIPTVSVGSDRNILLPTNTATINATASDSDGSIASYLWEKRSGPTVTLLNSATVNLTAQDLIEGIYIFRLTVTDNEAATNFDELQITVTQNNQAPTANAGSNRSITLPTSTIAVSGSGTDSDGTIASYSWSKVSALTATLTNASSTTLTASNMVEGVHTFGLTVTDDDGATGYDEVNVTVNSAAINQPPTASAGNDMSITLPVNSVSISGSGTDSDGTISSYLWNKVSGSTATLSGQNTNTLSASDLVAGTYIFRLTITDNSGDTDTDNVEITVFPENTNQTPVANAGGNQVVSLPTNSVTLNGTGSDLDGTIASYEWTKVSGPAATLTPNQNVVEITELVEGIYVFRLDVTDNLDAIGSDLVNVNVTSSNLPPTVDAGENQKLVLPLNTISLTAVASDPDGTISTYLWTKLSGPSATLTDENTSILTISDLLLGDYVFRVTATDDDGSSSSDLVSLSVLVSGTNLLPSVTVSNDVTLFLPTSTTLLTANATDIDGTITAYSWAKISGPTSTLTNPNTNALTITDLMVGISDFQVTVTDDEGATAVAIARVIVNPETSNQPPVSNAGGNKNIQLPTNSVVLRGSASDNDGSIEAYIWDKVSGPLADLTNTTNPVATVSNLQEGRYVFRLTVTDDTGASGFDQAIITVLPEDVNKAPTADAGANQILISPQSSTNLTGLGSDQDGSIQSYSWTKISGPAAFTLANETLPLTTVSDLVEGIYIFRLAVIDDQGASSSDDVQVTVNAAGSNIPPTADAGGNQVVNLPSSSINIFGSGSDNDGSVSSYLWVKMSGGVATLLNASTPTLTLNALEAGNYNFRLRIIDNDGASNDDFVSVVVNPEGVNNPPLVTAGPDRTVFLPTNSVTILGAISDQDGSIINRNWEQISGTPLSLGTVDSDNLLLSNLTAGNYVFRYNAVDDNQASAYDETTVTVLPEDSNMDPVVDLGEDVQLFLPVDSYTIDASVIDTDGSISSYIWSKVSGSSVTLNNSNEEDLNISDLTEGQLVLQLNAIDDDGGNSFDQINITIFPAGTNQPPIVTAGDDIELVLPDNQTALSSTAVDNDGTISSVVWTKVNGGNVTLSDINAQTAMAADLEEGTYTFRMEATDDTGATGADDIQVIVNPVPPNQPPIVETGSNFSIEVPQTNVVINGNATDADGTIVSYAWTQISGRSVSLTNANTKDLSIEEITEPDLYIFRLDVTDNEGGVGSDNILVSALLDASLRKLPPIAFAGEDRLLIAPENELTQLGVAFDPDGEILTYDWELIEGGNVDISYADTLLMLTGLEVGRYRFRFSITDEDTLSAADEFVLEVVDQQVIETPSFFSPNNDGISDVWLIPNIEVYGVCRLEVFNRNGQPVFEAEPYENNWDGTNNGTPLKQSDYYYILSCDNGLIKKTGALRIIR
jgi:gliding motility-associated-like protein